MAGKHEICKVNVTPLNKTFIYFGIYSMYKCSLPNFWKYNSHQSTTGIIYTIYILNLAMDGCKQEA